MNNEKVYEVMNSSAIISVTSGIIVLAAGIVCGVLSIVAGARLMKHKSNIIF